MIVFKLYIFVQLFLLTKQEFYWTFLSTNEFSITTKSATMDLSTFTKSNNSPQKNFCVVQLTIGHSYSQCGSGCCDIPKSPIKKTNQSSTNTSCHLNGVATVAKYLKNSDKKDDLVFFLFDGCFTTDENGNISNGTFLVTNNVNFEYNKKLNNGYFWSDIDMRLIQCNMLCNTFSFYLCYKEQTEDEMKDMLNKYKMTGYTFDWMNSAIEHQQESNWITGNELVISIVSGVVLVVVVFICFVIYSKKNSD